MPLTSFQKWVARTLAAQRTPESHVGGGAAINRADSSPRFSSDLDIFHDAAESVATCAERDAKVLEGAGCSVNWVLRQLGFYRAEVRRAEDGLRLDWTADAGFTPQLLLDQMNRHARFRGSVRGAWPAISQSRDA